MAGIPKRRKYERRHSYSLRCWEAEQTRRDWKLIDRLRSRLEELRRVFSEEEIKIEEELTKAYRAKPGTKYDITARKNKRK